MRRIWFINNPIALFRSISLVEIILICLKNLHIAFSTFLVYLIVYLMYQNFIQGVILENEIK